MINIIRVGYVRTKNHPKEASVKEYALTLISLEEVQLFEIIRKCVRSLPDEPDLGSDESGRPVELSCHILAKAVSRVFGLRFVDGHYVVGFRHSWVVTRGGHIIDVYPVAMLGGPVMLEGRHSWGLPNHLYRPHSAYPRDMRAYYREELRKPHIRNAINIVSRLLRESRNEIAAT